MNEPIEMKCLYCGTMVIRHVIIPYATCVDCKKERVKRANIKYREKQKKKRAKIVKKKKKIKPKKVIEIDPWAKYRPKSYLGITFTKN